MMNSDQAIETARNRHGVSRANYALRGAGDTWHIYQMGTTETVYIGLLVPTTEMIIDPNILQAEYGQ